MLGLKLNHVNKRGHSYHITIYYGLSHYTQYRVYPLNRYTVLFCFILLWLHRQFAVDAYDLIIHFHRDCFTGTGVIAWLSQCQWSKPGRHGYNEIKIEIQIFAQTKMRLKMSSANCWSYCWGLSVCLSATLVAMIHSISLTADIVLRTVFNLASVWCRARLTWHDAKLLLILTSAVMLR